MNPGYKMYHLKLTALTPLHIGNGRQLGYGYDYALTEDDYFWRFNEDAILDGKGEMDAKSAETLAHSKPIDLVGDDEYLPDSTLFRYVIQGVPTASDGNVREFIKDVYDRPYLPGTTLKGALRTAIGWSEWGGKHLHPISGDLFRNGKKVRKEFAAQDFERKIFGKKSAGENGSDANYDLMRAFMVSDSQSLPPNDSLQILNVAVFRRAGQRDKVDKVSSLEVIQPKISFDLTVKIDLTLFSDWAKQLHLGEATRLTDWVNICRGYSRQRIQTELSYYRHQKSAGIDMALKFYEQMERLEPELGANSFWLQLGWGTGWDDKTLGSCLKEPAAEGYLKKAIEIFDLGRGHTYPSVQEFPMSRRLPYSSNTSLGKPLGWALVEIEY
jgi:CRISPR-associated protein Csm5